MLRRLACSFLFVLLGLFLAAGGTPAWAGPGDSILIVAGGDATAQAAAAALQADLTAGNAVTVVNTGVPADLSPYTKIYDVRYNGNPVFSVAEQGQYLAFLQASAGNALFLMGENSGPAAATRNQAISDFILLAGGGKVLPPSADSTGAESLNLPFTTTPNALGSVTLATAGVVPYAANGSFIAAEANGTLGIGLYFAQGRLLNALTGCLVVVYDKDFVANAPTPGAANEVFFRQNLEAMIHLGGSIDAPKPQILILPGIYPVPYTTAGTVSAANLKADLEPHAAVTIADPAIGVPADLSPYSQIYDLRTFDTPPFTPAEQSQYVAFLNAAQGHMLFLIGENKNSLFLSRNQALSSFIALAGGGTIQNPTADTGGGNTSEHLAAPFTTVPNAISTVKFADNGLVTSAGTGGFGALEPDGASGGVLYFPQGTLANAPTGGLIVVYDLNFVYNAPNGGAVNEIAFRQNLENVAGLGGVLPGPVAPTIALASSLNPAPLSTPVTFTVTVTAPGPTPTGDVYFYDGAVILGHSTTVAGVATFTTSALGFGNHPIKAGYVGDGAVAPAVSTVLNQVLVAGPPIILVTSSANPGLVLAPITYTAIASGIPGVPPSGWLTFYDGPNVIGSGMMSGGIAVFSISTLTAGSHDIMANYDGSAIYKPSGSAHLMQLVNKRDPGLALASSANPAPALAPVVLTATLSSPVGTPSGTVAFYDGPTLLGNAALTAGVATYSTSALAAGSHTLTAAYQGDANFNGATSAGLVQTVSKLTPGLVLASSGNPANAFGTVTFTATLSAGAGAPSGSVAFYDGATLLGNGAVTAGAASFATATLATGSHAITAVYAGDATFATVTSAVLTLTVNKLTPALVLASSANPANVLGPVTFTATLSVSAGVATGPVVFYDGAAVLASVPLSAGSASYTTSSLAFGSHTITAGYAGDGNFNTATSAPVSQVLNKLNASLVLASSANPANVFAGVTITATLGNPAATGAISFYDGATLLATVPAAGGSASYASATLAVGSHVLSASYAGDGNFNAATSASLTQTINKLTPALTLASSANPVNALAPVTFTATLGATAGVATGPVNFYDGSTLLGSVALSAGAASYTTSSLAGGSHAITASYAGDPNFAAATSAAVAQVVSKLTTTLTLKASANPANTQAAVTFTAALGAASGTPAGSISFYDGSTLLGTGTVAAGTASYTTSTLAAGSHTITASFAGDATFTAVTSAAVTEVINKQAGTLALAASVNPAVALAPVTFTATYSLAGATGSIFFFDGATLLGSSTLAGGAASYTTSTLAAGNHSITATYGGDATYAGTSSGLVAQVINKAVPVITLKASANPSSALGAVTFTASFSSAAVTGTVAFFDGTSQLGSGTLAAGSASFTTSALAVGSHGITASYAGDANFLAGTSGLLTQVVNKLTTSMGLTSSINPSHALGTVTFTATLTAPAGNPGGTVSFYDGATLLGTGTLAGGVATYTATGLVVGSHTITATFAGDATFTAATSSTVTQVVNKLALSVVLGASQSAVTALAPVTFSASVTATTGTPTGSISFYDGSNLLGIAPLVGGGASLTVTNLAVGSHAITATYAGDANFAAGTSPVITETISKQSSTLTLTGPGTTHFGEAAAFTATVAAALGTATGTVTFSEGASVLGSVALAGGQAVFSTAALAQGTHSITAAYAGDGNDLGSASSAVTLTVIAPAIVFSNPNPNLVVNAGGSGSTQIGLSSLGTLAGPITLSATGLPLNATLTFSSNSVDPKALPATLTVTIQTTGPLQILGGLRGINAPLSGLGGGALLGFGFLLVPGRRRKKLGILMAGLILAMLGGQIACSTGSAAASLTSGAAGTPLGSYDVVLTATCQGATQATTTIHLTVK